MITGIELLPKTVIGSIKRKGAVIDTFTVTKCIAKLSDQGFIYEVVSGDACIVIRDIYRRFGGRELSLEEANNVVSSL